MPAAQGFTYGSVTQLIQLTVPVGQFPLSNTVLGANNDATGVVYNQSFTGMMTPTSLDSFTLAATGASPATGSSLSVSLFVAGTTFATASFDASGLSTGSSPGLAQTFAEGSLIIPQGGLVSIRATSTGWSQLSGGICIGVWGLALRL